MTQRERGLLKASFKRALVILHGGDLVRMREFWKREDGETVHQDTITALYDRALIRIVVESRHRKVHTAKLTEIGQCVARDLVRAKIERIHERELAKRPPIMEAA